MGTSIRINAFKGDETTKEHWALVKEYFEEHFEDYADVEEDIIESGIIYCPYSSAYLNVQINKDLRDKIDGSGITFNLFYEERDPDETLEV